ncbi:MAG: DUF4082 domain-containing protein, partial [Chloroflexi bacterium]|nr:DUF4082 domain-containing protein [Chloroflexota bacterium]
GHYAEDDNFFGSSIDNPPLHALSSVSAGGNGVFASNPSSTFPTQTYNDANYWVDVVFTLVAPPTPTPTATATVSPCPCSLWSSSATPVHPSVNDPQPVELGVKFASSEPGYIKGIRFYKGSANTGPHVADLWSASGQLLAETGFTSETASGWQEADFTTPVAIQPGQVYIAAYHTASGNYAEDDGGFTVAVVTPPLTALASGSSGGNGVYVYSSGNAFPTQTYNNANYWVDVVFVTSVPTATATATSTAAITATSTPAQSPSATSTIAPTASSTATATPTP